MEILFKLIQNYFIAFKGWYLWHTIVHKIKRKDNEYIFIFPSHEDDFAYYALLHLDDYLNSVYSNTAIIITSDMTIAKVNKLFSNRIRKTIKISQRDINAIKQYYIMCPFDSRMVFVALNTIEGRDGIDLIGKNGVTLEDIVVIGLYKFTKLKKINKPIYTGHDQHIIDFLSNK